MKSKVKNQDVYQISKDQKNFLQILAHCAVDPKLQTVKSLINTAVQECVDSFQRVSSSEWGNLSEPTFSACMEMRNVGESVYECNGVIEQPSPKRNLLEIMNPDLLYQLQNLISWNVLQEYVTLSPLDTGNFASVKTDPSQCMGSIIYGVVLSYWLRHKSLFSDNPKCQRLYQDIGQIVFTVFDFYLQAPDYKYGILHKHSYTIEPQFNHFLTCVRCVNVASDLEAVTDPQFKIKLKLCQEAFKIHPRAVPIEGLSSVGLSDDSGEELERDE